MSDYLVTTSDGLQHRLADIDAAAIAAYTSSPNTRAALEQAIATGSYAPAPPLTPIDPEPDPSGFRSSLSRNAEWNGWASTLPPVLYTNLATAAAQNNWTEAQVIYLAATNVSPPPVGGPTAWQQLAKDHGIPIYF